MMVHLENWTITNTDGTGYRLFGHAYGHPRVIDGHRVSTSPIVAWYGSVLVSASGTRYSLGVPDQDAVEKWKGDHRLPDDLACALLGERECLEY